MSDSGIWDSEISDSGTWNMRLKFWCLRLWDLIFDISDSILRMTSQILRSQILGSEISGYGISDSGIWDLWLGSWGTDPGIWDVIIIYHILRRGFQFLRPQILPRSETEILISCMNSGIWYFRSQILRIRSQISDSGIWYLSCSNFYNFSNF